MTQKTKMLAEEKNENERMRESEVEEKEEPV